MSLMYVVISTTYMSSDVESPSVKKAVANYEAHEDHARADLGYDSSWFWFFFTRNEAEIIAYVGVKIEQTLAPSGSMSSIN